MSEVLPYFERMKLIKLGLLPKEVVAKPKKAIAKKSAKRMKEENQGQQDRNGDDTEKQKWFDNRRKEMVGICQCGCFEKSQKNDDVYFRHCICHIFPQKLFPSVHFHKLNWVERKFWGGCHTNMDEQGMDKWPLMADWEDIKERFHHLAPLLTDEERTRKFYTNLETLIYKK